MDVYVCAVYVCAYVYVLVCVLPLIVVSISTVLSVGETIKDLGSAKR